MALTRNLMGVMVVSVLVLFGRASIGQTNAQRVCLSYEPTVVTLTGTLVRETFPGPPNYSSISQADEAETYWLIVLGAPVCVSEDRAEPALNPRQNAVNKVQLVLQRQQYEQNRTLLGREVIATGTLFGEHTGHHHTPALLTVRTLEALRS
jgi:hypothetical protein